MPYRVLSKISHSGTVLNAGESVPDDFFTPDQAQALIDVDAIAQAPIPVEAAQAAPHTQTFHPEATETLTVGAEPVVAPISLNTATEAELIDLPHIGAVTAGRILAQRPYDDLDDARQASGLSDSKWADLLLLPLVSL